ncbi:MAG: cellulose biosynthesis (CelD)-like protein [Verrucomicrobiales bacterium]|nr:cellulose biosynthesis (CelD)-like protein [Verrucomicrobiales bacterium]
MALSAAVIDEVAALEALVPGWDELAEASALPTSTGTWNLAVARAYGEPVRVAVVRDGSEIVGIVPLVERQGPYATRELHIMGANVTVGNAPPSIPGREADVAECATAALARVRPSADRLVLNGMPDRHPWAALMAERWPGAMRRLIKRESVTTEWLIDAQPGGYDAWLAARSARFRSQLRRHHRRLQSLSIRTRVTANTDELPRDLEAFSRLHRARWADRGGSRPMQPALERTLAEAGPRLLRQGRMFVLSLETDDRIVGSHVWFNAGGHHLGWLGGFDPELRGEPLDFVGKAVCIELAFARGATSLTLGPGDQEHKRRMTDRQETITSWRLPLRGPRRVTVVGGLAVRHARQRHADWRERRSGGSGLEPPERVEVPGGVQ